MPLRVLTWNLMHGRSQPPAGRSLESEFGDALAGWEWDVALLQEVPPWWPEELAPRLGAGWRRVLTSRNGLLPMRRAIATRWPDLAKSNGGGANAILVRDPAQIKAHRTLRLSLLPERRWLHAAQVTGAAGAVWIGNLHATVRDDAKARDEAESAAITLRAWASGLPAVLGGDFNVRSLALDGFVLAGRSDVDHVFADSRLPRSGDSVVLDRGSLSDHSPLVVTLGTAGRSE